MKNLLILATMLLTFGFANAQKIWNNPYKEAMKVVKYGTILTKKDVQ